MKNSLLLNILLSCISWFPVHLLAQSGSPGKQSSFTFGVSYTGDIVTNFTGGISQGNDYLGMENLCIAFNTDSAGLWKGGEFFLNAAITHGGMPSANLVGDYQGVSNIEAGDLTYMHELWIRQSIGPVCVIAGLQDLNVEFITSEFSGIFLNGSFGIHSTIAHNVPSPIFPLTALGAQFQWEIHDNITAKFAVFDGLPENFESNPFNLDWSLDPNDGYLTITEVCYHQNGVNGLYGTYKFGAYYHNHVCQTDENGYECITPNYGVYFLADKVLCKGRFGKQFSVFTQVGLSPRHSNENCCYFGFGLNYSSPFKKSRDDILGLAVAYAGFNNDIRGKETTMELTYLFKMNEYFFIQPDFQYIINPSGTDEKLANALVGIIRVGINF